MDISRRAFLAWSAAAGAALPLAGVEASATPALRREPGARPVCVFTKHLQWLDYDALAEVVAETGFDGLDLTVRPGGHVRPERVAIDLPRAVAAARRAGLVVPMMTTAINSAADPTAEAILRVAREQGIRYYRTGWLDYPRDRTIPESLERHRATLRELAELNARHQIHGAYQNHAGTRVGGPVWDLWTLLRDIDPRWLGCQYDIRHATVEGGMAWPLGLRLLAPHIRTIDLKDFVWERGDQGRWRVKTVPVGEGMVDFAAFFRLVGELGVDGPMSVHYEYPPLEGRNDLAVPERRRQAIELMRRDLVELRSLMRAAGL